MVEFLPVDLEHGGVALTVTAIWVAAHPYVSALLADLEKTIAGENDRRLVATLEHLRAVAKDGEGVLDAYHGSPSLKSICAKGALVWGNVRPGGRIRTELERWLPRFRTGSDHAVTKQASTVRAPSKMEEMRRHIRHCVATGQPIPSDGRGNASPEGVAYDMGKEFEWLRSNVKCMMVVTAALKTGTVTLGPKWLHPNPMSSEEIEERVDLICGFINGCDVPGGALPRKAKHRAQIDFEYIRDTVGLTGTTHERHPRVVAACKDVKAKRGLRLPGEQLPDTWASLMLEGLQQIQELKKHTKSVAVTVSAHKGVLETIMRQHDAEACLDDVVGTAFDDRLEDDFDDRVEKLIAGRQPGDAGNVRRAAGLWRDIHADARARNGLPQSFGQTLSILINRSGMTMAAVADKAETTTYLLANWIAGRLVVGVDKRDEVARIANTLGVDQEVLLSRATGHTLNRADSTCSEDYLKLEHRVRARLPRETRTWSGEKLEDAVRKVKPLVSCGTAFGNLVRLSQDPELRLPPLQKTQRLEQELAELLSYKTAGSAWPLLRMPNAIWATDATVEMNMAGIEGFLRFCAAPGELGGAAIPSEGLTLGLLATVLAPAYRVFCARRYEDMDWDGQARGMRFTAGDIDFMRLVRSFTNETCGFLTQQPKFGERIPLIDQRLPPRLAETIRGVIPGAAVRPIVTSLDVERYRSRWLNSCTDAYAQANDFLGFMETKRGPSRDPFATIIGLINGVDPLLATPFADVLECQLRAERSWPSAATAPTLHALAVQASVMHRLEGICVFRPNNLVGMDFVPTDQIKPRQSRLASQSQIRKRDGVWEIEIPFGQFKNGDNIDLFGTPTHRIDYFRRLEDEANLYGLLDYFFLDQRNVLRMSRGSPAAFLTGKSPRISEGSWATACRDWSAEHVARNEVANTGIVGVLPFSPYAYRHIVGCDTLITSDAPASERPREAARRLQTSERMILGHYGFLLPGHSFAAGNQTYSKSVKLALTRLG